MTKILEVKKLTKYYGKVLGAKDVSFDLEEGEIFGFIGPNGAGKSTTIRSILNLINKSSGKVLFYGKEFDKNDIQIKREIGYLPSEVNLYEELTVKEMLNFHESLFKDDLSKKRKELVKRLKLDENKKIEDLSLGNLKKLGIILALMHSPKLIVLDEPTSGLDPIVQQEFFSLLKEEKDRGATILYSTHILTEISRICDRVAIIKGGNLLSIEPIKDLKEKSLSFVTIISNDIEKIIKDLKIKECEKEENTIKFKNTIKTNDLISKLSKYNIDKLYIEPASIEEIFMHYYR